MLIDSEKIKEFIMKERGEILSKWYFEGKKLSGKETVEVSCESKGMRRVYEFIESLEKEEE